MKYCTLGLFCLAVALGFSPAVHARALPAFSLDDNPAMPITSPPGWIPGFGAEDPFGLGTYGGPLAPSPSLAVGQYWDSDILRPGMAAPVPAMHVMFQQRIGYVDAVSENFGIGRNNPAKIHLSFSVDRISMGLPGTDVRTEFLFNQQPGDIYRTTSVFAHPTNFAALPPGPFGYNGPLPTAGGGGSNSMIYDESQLTLTAGMGPGNLIKPGALARPITRGSHDNVDAVNFQALDMNGDYNTDKFTYFSVYPDERGISGRAPSDIYVITPGTPAGGAGLFAPANTMGLLDYQGEYDDNIDALSLWDRGKIGVLDRNKDYALFSLSHGSPSLNAYGLSPADIFFTNFTGAFWLYATAADQGLQYFGSQEYPMDNVDALEVVGPGDANLDGVVDISDLGILAGNYGGPGTWLTGDFNADHNVDISDLGILAGNYSLASKTAVPEPGTLSLLIFAAAGLIRRRRKA